MATLLACLPIFMSGREIARWEDGVLLAYRTTATAATEVRRVSGWPKNSAPSSTVHTGMVKPRMAARPD
uniref:hypothetical protein n=1 Tax=Klebsiella pneumoniae TaxID=573 RepID=UPI00190F33C8